MKRRAFAAVISAAMVLTASLVPVSAQEEAKTENMVTATELPQATQIPEVSPTAEPAASPEGTQAPDIQKTPSPSDAPESTQEPQTFSETEDFRYRESDGGVIITGYKSSDAEVLIPQEIEDKLVTGIESNVFAGNTAIKSVVVPEAVVKIEPSSFKGCTSLETVALSDDIQEIGESAFENCSALKSINMPSKLVVIYGNAFAECTSLETVTFPDTLQYFGEGAFYNCTLINSVTIPKAVDDFNGSVFAGCTSLENINVSGENPNYMSEANVIYSKDGKTLVAFPSTYMGSYTVPENVETIGYGAFYKCAGVETIVLPEGLKVIDNAAFVKCTSLTSITIPSSVTSLGGYAFSDCTALKSVTISAVLPQIKEYTFANCASLEKITTANKINTWGQNAFIGCSESCVLELAEENNTISMFGTDGEGAESSDAAVTLMFNGEKVEFEPGARIINDSTVVPMRVLFEAMGAEVNWNEEDRIVNALRDDISITLAIGSSIMWKNGVEVALNAPAVIIDDYTFVPVRAVSEAFGANVNWDEETRVVSVTFDSQMMMFGNSSDENFDEEVSDGTAPIAVPSDIGGKLPEEYTEEVPEKTPDQRVGGRISYPDEDVLAPYDPSF